MKRLLAVCAILFAVFFGVSAHAHLIGVDFNYRSSYPTPTNWTSVSTWGTTDSLGTETGGSTEVNLAVTNIASKEPPNRGFYYAAVNAVTIPQHAPSLANIGGNIYGFAMPGSLAKLELKFTGLDGGKSYKIWVFGLRTGGEGVYQDVSIEGLATISFPQQAISGNLVVNNSLGNENFDLSSYAKDITPSALGEIIITITSNPLSSDKLYSLAGVAIDVPTPTVTTQAVTGVGTTTAIGNGNITNLGDPNPTQHGVCWNTTGTPTTADSKTEEGAASETGAFTSNMTGLSNGTTYYVRAYATNAVGTEYGEEVNFTATERAPTVTTQAVTGIGINAATGNGNITDLGDPNPTQHGVCWNTTGNPTVADSHKDNGAASTTGVYTADITGLTEGTTYYVKAYATNTEGTVYGAQVAFKTNVTLTMARTPEAGGTTTPVAGSTTSVAAGVAQNITASPATGYHFINWTAAPSGNATFENASNAATSVTLTGSATVTANFAINTYTLTAATNPVVGGTVTKNPDQGTYDHGSNVQVTATANANYVFTGWSGNLSGAANPTSITMDGNKNVTANFALTYTVTYNGNGNTGGSAPTDGNAYQAGADVTVLGNTGALVKTGYMFKDWNTAADGNGTSYAPGANFFMPGANVMLYAQWTANEYTVTFDANGGTDPVPANKSVTYNEAYGQLAETTRDAYSFAGWFTAATGGTQITSETVVNSAENHTLYAQWTHIPYYMAKNAGNWSNTGIWFTNTTGGTNPADYATPATEMPNANNSLGIIVNALVAVDTAVTIDQTTVNGEKTLTVNNEVTLTLANGTGTDLTVFGVFTNNGTVICNAGTTVDFAGVDQILPAITYQHLTTSGAGTKTLGGDIILRGNLTIGAGTILDGSENNYGISIDGNWTNNGTFTAREGEVRFEGSAVQSITGTPSFHNLTIANTVSVDASGCTALTVRMHRPDGCS